MSEKIENALPPRVERRTVIRADPFLVWSISAILLLAVFTGIISDGLMAIIGVLVLSLRLLIDGLRREVLLAWAGYVMLAVALASLFFGFSIMIAFYVAAGIFLVATSMHLSNSRN